MDIQTVAEQMYDIRVRWQNIDKFLETDPIFELTRIRWGKVTEDEVDARNPTADINLNSKDYDFLHVISQIGLLPLLASKVKAAYSAKTIDEARELTKRKKK